MIVRSVFTVSCPSCGAPLALTETLASWSDESRADLLEISRFLPSFLGKMAVFDNGFAASAHDKMHYYCDFDLLAAHIEYLHNESVCSVEPPFQSRRMALK